MKMPWEEKLITSLSLNDFAFKMIFRMNGLHHAQSGCSKIKAGLSNEFIAYLIH